jgi:1-acyl-sn-glycerol-3-phosphate acyltransferase
MLHAYFRGQIHGTENVPQSGPLLVVSNHASYFDPPIVSNCVRRPVAYMAKEELFKIPVLAQAIKLYGAYPVSRGSADRNAIRSASITVGLSVFSCKALAPQMVELQTRKEAHYC